MIKAEEYRIGNYVLINLSSTKRFVLQEIDLTKEQSFRVKAIEGKEEIWYSSKSTEILPVLLNDDLLIRIGFKMAIFQEDRSNYSLTTFTLTLNHGKEINLNKTEYNYALELYDGKKPRKIKYLHLLQNLYKDMTSEDFMINW